MAAPTPPLTTDPRDAARRIAHVRWAMLLIAAALALAAPSALALRLPQWPLVGVIVVTAAWNLATQWRIDRAAGVAAAEIAVQLGFDIVVWSVLLFFTGGAANPLVSLLLLPVVQAALALGAAATVGMTALAAMAYTLLTTMYVPLPIADPVRATQLHLGGMWLTFMVSASLLAGITWRMTRALAQRDGELAAAREAALRDERVLAMGTLAAGAAHELGTPLATMAVVIGDLRADPATPAHWQPDLAVLGEQIARCKSIIAGMAERAGSPGADAPRSLPAIDWLSQVHARWSALRGVAESRLENFSHGQTANRAVRGDAVLEQALDNLLDNAARAGPPVVLRALCTHDAFVVDITDHGPGFAPAVLRNAGTAPLPPHAHGAGVGLMLTRAAVERLGGTLLLANEAGGGLARVQIPWRGLTP